MNKKELPQSMVIHPRKKWRTKVRRHLWNTTSNRSSHQRRKEGIFNAGTKLYARGGSGPGAGHLQVPRLQGDPQAQRRTP